MVGRPVGVPRTRRRTGRRGRGLRGTGGWGGRGWVSAGETVLIDSEEPPSRRSKLGGLAPGPLSFSRCLFSALSLGLTSSFSLSYFLSVSRSLLFLAARANLASANKCSSVCHPRQLSVVPFFSLLSVASRGTRLPASKSADRSDLHLVGVRDRSFRARDSLRSDDQTSRYSKLPTTYPRRV